MTLRWLMLSATALAWLANAGLSTASTFEFVAPEAARASALPMTLPLIRMTGLIEDGDSVRIRAMLEDLRRATKLTPTMPLATVELSSLGGDLLEGLKLGYLFREFGVATVVRAGDLCLSSCALAFLGGTADRQQADAAVSRTVEIGATLGFHSFWLNPNHALARDAASPSEGIIKGFNTGIGAASLVVRYAASLGIDPGFIAGLLGRPPEVWQYVGTAGDFIDLRICPAGQTRRLPLPQTRAVNICLNTLGVSEQGFTLEAQEMSSTQVKRHLLDSVRQDASAHGARGRMVTQIASILKEASDSRINSLYADFRAAGLPLPEILGSTFKLRGLAPGAQEFECIVSLAPDDPDRFDVVLKGPGGLTRPAQRLPSYCQRILGFERSEVLNPRK